jgi:hypothetical protein
MHPQDYYPRGVLDTLTLSSAVAAKLRVLDISGCRYLRSIDAVRSCVQLRCLWMPGCGNVSDLSPLAACSETLEELWMAGSSVRSLAPLKACTRLRKLDLFGCNSELRDQVADLRLACTQLADPASVMIEGLVHGLQPSIPPGMQQVAANDLMHMSQEGGLAKNAIVAAGAIPALVQLLRPGPLALAQVQRAAASALGRLAAGHAENGSAISAAGAVPLLVQLQGSTDVRVRAAAAAVLHRLAAFRA